MKFRKKPVVIEAFKWAGNLHDLGLWAAHVDFEHRKATGRPLVKDVELPISFIDGHLLPISFIDGHLEIATLEGVHRALIGDWIIQGVVGEFYPCRSEVFEATYEEVSP